MIRIVSRRISVNEKSQDMWVGPYFNTVKESLEHLQSCRNLYWMRYAYAMFFEEDGLRRWATRKDFILLDGESK